MRKLSLGLIGDNIRASRAGELHRACGRAAGIEVTYDHFIPNDLGQGFDAVFDTCVARLQGFNVTLPYKERAAKRVRIDDPAVRRLGAVNTVLVGPEGPVGANTDFSGFVTAFRTAFGGRTPGRAVILGAGGVGRAIAFGLVDLGAAEIVVVDSDPERASALAAALGTGATTGDVRDVTSADGVVNATPLGMEGYGGCPVPESVGFPSGGWAFDAVYTPVDTPFRARARAAGMVFLSGWELFFHQGLDAFALFSGQPVTDPATIRAALSAPPASAA